MIITATKKKEKEEFLRANSGGFGVKCCVFQTFSLSLSLSLSLSRPIVSCEMFSKKMQIRYSFLRSFHGIEGL